MAVMYNCACVRELTHLLTRSTYQTASDALCISISSIIASAANEPCFDVFRKNIKHIYFHSKLFALTVDYGSRL